MKTISNNGFGRTYLNTRIAYNSFNIINAADRNEFKVIIISLLAFLNHFRPAAVFKNRFKTATAG